MMQGCLIQPDGFEGSVTSCVAEKWYCLPGHQSHERRKNWNLDGLKKYYKNIVGQGAPLAAGMIRVLVTRNLPCHRLSRSASTRGGRWDFNDCDIILKLSTIVTQIQLIASSQRRSAVQYRVR